MNTNALAEIMLKTGSGIERPFYFRRESHPDNQIVAEIFKDGVYDLVRFKQTAELLKYAATQTENGRRPFIVDAGAHIGAAAVWFASRFLDGDVIAIEPEPANFTLLEKNCAGMNIRPLNAAIGARDGHQMLSDPGLGDWGYRVGEDGDVPVTVLSMKTLVDTHMERDHFPLICKVDIEGSEREMFSDATDWLDSFALLIIELHDWMLPGENTSRNALKALTAREFDVVVNGENIFCFNTRLLY